MAEKILQHTTIDGERWDQIAAVYYGRADMFTKLIEANPDVPIYDVFPGGLTLNIPVVEEANVETDLERMPPWKR